jgi:branched-chain amino acid transport system ATP-binding protein
MRKMLLEVEGLCVNYGHIEAIRDISFGVPEGTVTTLIGANGAGKTTTLKTVSGLRKVRAGAVRFEGRDITQIPPYERVALGISVDLRRGDVCLASERRGWLELSIFLQQDVDVGHVRGRRMREAEPRVAERLCTGRGETSTVGKCGRTRLSSCRTRVAGLGVPTRSPDSES